jgi:hypothetical protein
MFNFNQQFLLDEMHRSKQRTDNRLEEEVARQGDKLAFRFFPMEAFAEYWIDKESTKWNSEIRQSLIDIGKASMTFLATSSLVMSALLFTISQNSFAWWALFSAVALPLCIVGFIALYWTMVSLSNACRYTWDRYLPNSPLMFKMFGTSCYALGERNVYLVSGDSRTVSSWPVHELQGGWQRKSAQMIARRLLQDGQRRQYEHLEQLLGRYA